VGGRASFLAFFSAQSARLGNRGGAKGEGHVGGCGGGRRLRPVQVEGDILQWVAFSREGCVRSRGSQMGGGDVYRRWVFQFSF
jgi:hypothetical protein